MNIKPNFGTVIMNLSDTQNATRAREYDAADSLAHFRTYFHLPAGTIYLDGNSLGAMPLAVTQRLANTANQEWAEGLIRSWNSAAWLQLPLTVGDRIAPLIGVSRGEVAVGDSTSVNLFKCLAAALPLRPGHRVILLEQDNFPTDNYMAEGLAALVGNIEIRVFDSTQPIEPHLVSNDVAVVLLSHVHYRTARVQHMSAVTKAIHAAGALVIWDLSHSVGAVKVELAKADADFAVGCTYKYLNGGPGAPAFVWISPRLASDVKQPLCGWMGHNQPFAFTPLYEPGPAVKRFVCGTPQVLSLTALDQCLKLWSEVDLDQLFEKSRRLTRFFIELVESECRNHPLVLQSPRDDSERGSHVSFGLDDIGYPVMRALIHRGVIGDFRTPNTIRFGFTPLYIGFSDVERAVEVLRQVLDERLWDVEAYKIREAVT